MEIGLCLFIDEKKVTEFLKITTALYYGNCFIYRKLDRIG